MKLIILLIGMSAAILGCGSESVYDIIPEIEEDNKLHAIVLIEDSNDQNNHPYYNALLEVNNLDIIQPHIVSASDHPEVPDYFHAEHFPCLILYENGEVVMHLDDAASMDDIVDELNGNVDRFTRKMLAEEDV